MATVPQCTLVKRVALHLCNSKLCIAFVWVTCFVIARSGPRWARRRVALEYGSTSGILGAMH
jgi:hypothetical protein